MLRVNAFEELYRAHRRRVLEYLLRLSGGDLALAEDLVQQVFLNFWSHRHRYDLTRPPEPLLLAMARNAWINAAGRRRSSPLKQDVASNGPGPVADAQGRDLEAAVRRALDGLDAPVRQVFVLSRYQSMTYAQIARALDISVKTVEARLSRALEQLRRSLRNFLPRE